LLATYIGINIVLICVARRWNTNIKRTHSNFTFYV